MMYARKVLFLAVIALAALLAACSGSDAEKEEAGREPNEAAAAAANDSDKLAAQGAAHAADIAGAAQRDQTEELRAAVEKEIIDRNIRVKSFTLVHKSGNEYKGVLVAKQPVGELVFGEFTYMVDVVFDGKTIVWEAGSGTQTACCEPMSAEEIQDLMKKMFEVASEIGNAQDNARVVDQAGCDGVSKVAESERVFLNPPSTHAVIGEGRLYFHVAPNDACRSKDVFVIPGDELIAYTEFNGWYSVMYLNPETGEDFNGWVKSERLQMIGAIRPKF